MFNCSRYAAERKGLGVIADLLITSEEEGLKSRGFLE